MRPPPWSARSTAALLLVVLLGGASLFWLSHPWFEATKETYDASIYLLCAKSILAGEGYSVLGMPFTVRPPGFSLLLAPILAARGMDFHAFHLLVGMFGVAASAFLFVLARPRIGDLAALGLALAVFLNPSFRHLSNQVMSDVPGLALSLGCLLVARWAEAKPSLRRDAGLGVAISMAAYVRTAVLLVAVAVLAARILRSARREPTERQGRARVLVLPAVVTILLLPWSLRNALQHPPWPAEQTLLASYSTGMWHEDGGDPSSPRVPLGDVLARAATQAPHVLADLGDRLDPTSGGVLLAALGAVMLAAICAVAVARREAPELFALLSFGVLALYFAEDWRLALPIFPLGLLALADVLGAAIGRVVGAGPARAATAVALFALAIADFAPGRGVDEVRAAHEADQALARDLRVRLSPRDRLAAPVGWHWSVLLDRPVWNLYFAGKRGGAAGMEKVIEEREIDAVIVRVEPPETPRTLEFLEARYGPAERLGPLAIVRTRK